jgi:hypothetical protein
MHWRKGVYFPQRFKDITTLTSFKNKYIIVRYEDLILNSKIVIKELMKHINLPFQESMLFPKFSKGDPLTFGDIFYTRDEYYRSIETSSINNWKVNLNYKQIEDVYNIVKNDLNGFGYRNIKMEVEERKNIYSKMNSNNPVILIMIATYNGDKFLSEQIQSIQSQTYENWEIILRDDNSNDQTFNLIQQHAATDNRIKFIKQEKNKKKRYAVKLQCFNGIRCFH